MKPIFYPGLGERKKDYKFLSKYFEIAQVDWNTGKSTEFKNFDIVISFSLGCVFSLDIALQKPLKKLILCSPTPFETLGNHLAEEVVFIIGEKEDFLEKIFKPLCKDNVKMIIVPSADHKIDDNYLEIILDNI